MFDFLKNVKVEPNKKEVKERVYSKQELNPTNGADIRVFKDGRVYPSEALAQKDNLEYAEKGNKSGNAYDVFPSNKWNWYPKDIQQVVFIAMVPKSAPKADLFSEVTYDTDGTPKSTVLDQGAATFGKKYLVQMLADAYTQGNVETLFGTNNYVDLVIVRDAVVATPDNIYLIPKVVSRGEDAGKPTFVRRENLVLNPLGLFTAVDVASTSPAQGEDEIAGEEPAQVLDQVEVLNGEVTA